MMLNPTCRNGAYTVLGRGHVISSVNARADRQPYNDREGDDTCAYRREKLAEIFVAHSVAAAAARAES